MSLSRQSWDAAHNKVSVKQSGVLREKGLRLRKTGMPQVRRTRLDYGTMDNKGLSEVRNLLYGLCKFMGASNNGAAKQGYRNGKTKL